MAARRTTMNIDHELVDRAREILGTDNATQTVHAALTAIIRRFELERVAKIRFADGDWEEAKRLRQPKHLRDEHEAARRESDAS